MSEIKHDDDCESHRGWSCSCDYSKRVGKEIAKSVLDKLRGELPTMEELSELADSPESDAWLNDRSFFKKPIENG